MSSNEIAYQQGTDHLTNRNFQQAMEAFQTSNLPQSRWNHSLVSLLLKDYSKWPDIDYLCSGSGFSGSFTLYDPPLPLWDGKPTNQRVVLLADQGAGDCVIFLRYLTQVKKIVPNVAVKAIKELHRLINLYDVPAIESVENCDTCYPLMLLPRYFQWDSAPTTYLFPPQSPQIAEVVNAFNEPVKIGLCWSGNPYHPTNKQRSVPLELFNDFPKMFNLQFGQHVPQLHNINMLMNDFLDTAQIINEMDVVITVSTSISVISAAMGKPTWVMLDDLPFWLWGLTETTPWFPSVKMYRQDKMGDWLSVVQRVKSDLLNNSY